MFGDDSVCNLGSKALPFPSLYRGTLPPAKTRAALIEKLAASGGGFASWFQSGVPAERRRRQLPIGSASLLRGDGWACHAPSPCRCNWGFSCCGTTRFVFPRGGGAKSGILHPLEAQSFGGIFNYSHGFWSDADHLQVWCILLLFDSIRCYRCNNPIFKLK